jgi:tetratricopeptide (TPR) repeat protein
MNQTCSACGNSLSASGECGFCGGNKRKESSWLGAMAITLVIIGSLIAGTVFLIKTFGNPLDFFKYSSRENHYYVFQTSENLPVSREPVDSITLDQFSGLRENFENRQFNTLNSILEDYQIGFEMNSRDEFKVYDAFRVFAGTMPIYEEILDDWVNFSPERFPPYLARAAYYYARAWESRGNKYAKDTSEDQFREMQFHLSKAADDIDTALNINPHLLPAYYLRIGIFNTTGDYDGEDGNIQRALELFPDSFLIRARFMWAKEPRWGGSYREMENFAKDSEQYADSNPAMTALYGFICYDQSRRLVKREKYKKAVEYCTKALSYGDNWLFYKQRANIYHYYLNEPHKAMIDIDRSIYLRPTIEESYRLRSKIYYKDGDMDNAYDDIMTAEVIKPGDAKTRKWREWVGEKLMYRGHKVYKEDLNAAIEQYNFSIQFDPQASLPYYWRGVAYYRLKQIDSALPDFQRSIELGPHHFESYLMMDYALLESKQFDEIIGYWSQFIELEPDHARAYLERSGTYYHKRDYANSLKDLKAACDLGNEEGCKRYRKYKDIWN